MRERQGTMEITTVIGCKVNCKFCPQDKLIRNYTAQSHITSMSIETFKCCLDKIPKSVRIDFSGMSEPWLNDQCTEMVRYAARKGHQIAVYTTLVGMTSNQFRDIHDINYDEFVIHLPDTLDHCHIPVTDGYLRLAEEIVSESPTKLLQTLSFFSHGPVPAAVSAIFGKHPNFELLHHKCLQDRAGNLDIRSLDHYSAKGSIMCSTSRRAINENVLLPDGTVLLCCMDYSMKHKIGNLLVDEYDDLFRSEQANSVRMAFLDDSIPSLCRYCNRAVSAYKFKRFSQKVVKKLARCCNGTFKKFT